jgi:hypothetical protein
MINVKFLSCIGFSFLGYPNYMEDKFLRGIIAGLIAGIAKDIPALIAEFFITDVFPSYWDYSGLVSFGKSPGKPLEYIHALGIQVGFSAAVGVAIVYLISKIRSKHYLLEGAVLGLLVWFIIRGIVYIAQVPDLIKPHEGIALLNSLTSIGYGVLVAYIDHYLATKK